MSDRDLMAKIYSQYHTPLAAAAHPSSVPESMLAALVANESGGDSAAQRFEPAVFLVLAEVMLNKKASYSPAGAHHPLGPQDLLPYVAPEDVSSAAPPIGGGFRARLGRLGDLATSYGLTQIMGWHCLEMSKPFSLLLNNPKGQLDFTVVLVTYFANRYNLDMTKEFAEFFTCWNCGRPDGNTFDPNYVPNGLARMALYDDLRKAGLAGDSAEAAETSASSPQVAS